MQRFNDSRPLIVPMGVASPFASEWTVSEGQEQPGGDSASLQVVAPDELVLRSCSVISQSKEEPNERRFEYDHVRERNRSRRA
jgi:hypothetical protein